MQKPAAFTAAKTQAPKTPVAPSTPKPIDPALLRHISGGTGPAAGPNGNW